jgi:hypothetical protein
MLKKLIIGFIVIIGVVLISALFIEEDYTVTRSIEIIKSQKEIFDYLKFLKNQDEFSIWSKIDPNMKKSYQGIDGGIGFISSWDSVNEDVGKGEQEIIKLTPTTRIDFELRFIEPFEATHDAYFILEQINDNYTKIIWGFDGRMEYPMNIISLFMNMDSMLGPDLRQGLINLKEIMEK